MATLELDDIQGIIRRGYGDMHRQIVTFCRDDMLIKGVAKIIIIAVGVVTPVGYSVTINPLTVAIFDSLVSALAGWFPIPVG